MRPEDNSIEALAREFLQYIALEMLAEEGHADV